MTYKIDMMKHIGSNRDIVGAAFLKTVSQAFPESNDFDEFLKRIGFDETNTEVEVHMIVGGQVLDMAETLKSFEQHMDQMITERAQELLNRRARDLQDKLYEVEQAISTLITSQNLELDD